MNDSLRISTAKILMNFLFFIICQVGLGQLVAVVVDTEGELVATAEPVNDEIEQIHQRKQRTLTIGGSMIVGWSTVLQVRTQLQSKTTYFLFRSTPVLLN